MLQKLIINNYAIIDKLELHPDSHLNIVTGETGAGKSIILGALSLILGERADTSVLINKDEKCVVEAYFDVSDNMPFQNALADAELDKEDVCIIRREINTTGKSRAFINDTPVTLGILGKLTSLLVDLHQQFDNLAIEDDNFQMDVLDAIAQNAASRVIYAELYKKYITLGQQINELQQRQAAWQKEADYKTFLLEELQQAAFKEDEVEQAEVLYRQMANAEKIITVLQGSRFSLTEGENPLVNELKRSAQQLQSISDVFPEVTALQERLLSSWAELKDIGAELEMLENKVNIDPAELQRLQERIDTGYRLFKKHAVKTTNELLEIQAKLSEELKASLDLGEQVEKLKAEQESVSALVMVEAGKLSAARKKTAPALADSINELLKAVGMPNARLKIDVVQTKDINPDGIDEVSFLLDANKSGRFLPVYKAASGGEMSRIMLCVKSLTAKAMQLPTLIFDEVDTGISGEAAKQVGILLNKLAAHHQVICITHQPQVAAKGSAHYYVYKEEISNRIITKVKMLEGEERVQAIARMIGGEKLSEAAMQNARELVAE